jgi:hypothetical protein
MAIRDIVFSCATMAIGGVIFRLPTTGIRGVVFCCTTLVIGIVVFHRATLTRRGGVVCRTAKAKRNVVVGPFSISHVVGQVNLCCCYCCPAGAVVAAAADRRSYAALLSLLRSCPTIIQTHLLLLNNSGQATSIGNYSLRQIKSR